MIVKNYMEGGAINLRGFNPKQYKTAAGAAKALYRSVCKLAAEYGQNPAIEVTLQDPATSAEFGTGRGWRVIWEAGPYEWAIMLSMSDEMFVQRGWLAEPYYSFDLVFHEE